MELAVGVLFFGLLALTTLWRFGFFTSRYQKSEVEQIAAARGYQVDDDRSGFTAVVEGVTIHGRMVVTPGHRSPATTWTLTASAIKPVEGDLTIRPKHEDEPAGLRVGDALFDTCFHVAGTSRVVACHVLGDEVRRALVAFGPYGESAYKDGLVTLTWESHEPVSEEEMSLAVDVLSAYCGQHEQSPYR